MAGKLEMTDDAERRFVTRLPSTAIEIEFIKHGFDRHGKTDSDRISDDHRVDAYDFPVHID